MNKIFQTRPRLARPFVAVIIIVILGLLIAGNLSRQRVKAARVTEARNLQQWGIALNLYLIDNKNQLPDVGKTPVTPEQTHAWFNALPLYISEEPLASLPPEKRPRPGVPSLWIRPNTKAVKIWDPEVFYFNYGMNRFLQPLAGARSFRIYEINAPGNVVFLAPISDFSPAADPENIVFPEGKNVPANILFCDGHVQPVLKETLLNPTTLEAAQAEAGVSWYQK